MSSASHLPPESLWDFRNGTSAWNSGTSTVTPWSTPVFILMTNGTANGRYYHVQHIDWDNSAFFIYPQFPLSVASGNTFRWIYGGGVCLSGSNTNVWEVGVAEATNCGIGISLNMLHGPSITAGLFNACAMGVQAGGSYGNIMKGSALERTYLESCTADLLLSSITTSGTLGICDNLVASRVYETINPIDSVGNPAPVFAPWARFSAQIPSEGYTIQGFQVIGPRGATVADPTGGATVDSQSRTALGLVIDRMQAHGLIS